MDQSHQPGQTFEPETTNKPPVQSNNSQTPSASNSEPTNSNGSAPSPEPKPTESTQQISSQTTTAKPPTAIQPAREVNSPSTPPPPIPPPATGSNLDQTQPGSQKTFSKPNNRKLKTILLALGVIFLIAGGGAYAYFGIIVPNQPENVMKAMIANTFNAKTLKSSGQLEIKSGDYKYLVDIESATDVSDFQNPKLSMRFNADLQVTNLVADVRLLDNELFFNLSGLDGIEQLAQSQLSMNPEMAEAISGVFDSILGQWFIVNKSLVTEAIDFSQISQSEIDAIKQAADGVEFFDIVTVHDDEQVKGSDAYHYTVRPSNEGIKIFLDDLVGKTLAGEEVTQEDIDKLKEQIDSNPILEDSTLDVWVYKSSKLLAKTQIELTEENEEYVSNSTTEFFDYNEPLTIEKPESPKSIMELMALLQSAVSQILGDGFTSPGSFQDSFELESEFTPATLGEILQR